MSHLAPIVLFTYNRLSETKQTIEALQKNYLAIQSELFIFSDGPKDEAGKQKVGKVRNYLKTIGGFKTVKIYESPHNKGLASSIIDGVTKIIDDYEKVIVLEDDLVTSPNFLDFVNQGLNFYNKDNEIISISGYTLDLPSLPGNKDYYFGYRASSWGWGTWKNRWSEVDWEVHAFKSFINDSRSKKLLKRGGSDMVRMLQRHIQGENDSWAIRFCLHQSLNDLKTVFPTISKVQSIGFSKDATHTVGTKRFVTKLDSKEERNFSFDSFSAMDDHIVKEFRSKFSIKNRALDKIKRILSS